MMRSGETLDDTALELMSASIERIMEGKGLSFPQTVLIHVRGPADGAMIRSQQGITVRTALEAADLIKQLQTATWPSSASAVLLGGAATMVGHLHHHQLDDSVRLNAILGFKVTTSCGTVLYPAPAMMMMAPSSSSMRRYHLPDTLRCTSAVEDFDRVFGNGSDGQP